MQPVFAIPACKCARDVDAFAGAFPFHYGRHGFLALRAFELVTQVVVVGGIVAEHGRAAGKSTLDFAMINGGRKIYGGDDGGSRGVRLLFDGQWEAGRAAVVGRGHNEALLRGIGGLERGCSIRPAGRVCIFAGRCRDIDRASLGRWSAHMFFFGRLRFRRGEDAGLRLRLRTGGRVGLVAGKGVALLTALVVAHLVFKGWRLEGVLGGGSQVVSDLGGSA